MATKPCSCGGCMVRRQAQTFVEDADTETYKYRAVWVCRECGVATIPGVGTIPWGDYERLRAAYADRWSAQSMSSR